MAIGRCDQQRGRERVRQSWHGQRICHAQSGKNHLQGDYVSLYVPTTPNPTSGFFLMVPRADTIELDMSVDAALKYIVSMGVVAPEYIDRKLAEPAKVVH